VVGPNHRLSSESSLPIGGSRQIDPPATIGQNECSPLENGLLIGGGGEVRAHVIGCCLEMLSLVLLILALRRFISFHLFAGGPLTFLVNSGVVETR
jgi:hypothetical protein